MHLELTHIVVSMHDSHTTLHTQIRGTSLGISNYDCVFGDDLASATEAQHVASGVLECAIPPAPPDTITGVPFTGSTSLHVVSTVGFTSNRLQFTYFAPPTILGVVPSFGSTDGGTRVIAAGIGFADFGGGVACSFGGVETPGEVVSATEVACSSPAAAIAGFDVGEDNDTSRFVPLLVTLNGRHFGADAGEQSIETEVTFEYADVAVVSFISPMSGPPGLGGDGGGTLVADDTAVRYLTAHGAHFREGADLACRFGTLLAAAVYVSPSEVDCLIPPLSSATGDTPTVAVTVNGVDFSREGPPSTTFTYLSSPELLGLLPAMGPSTGGTTVRVIGSNFSPDSVGPVQQASLICRFEMEDDASVALDDTSNTSDGEFSHTAMWDVAAIVESDSAGTCVSPAVVASVVTASGRAYATVHVSADGGSSFSTSGARFFFYPTTTVSSVVPATLPASEGGDVVVAGEGFLSGEGTLLCHYKATANISLGDISLLPEGISVVQNEGTTFAFTAVAIWLSPELVQCKLPPLEVEEGTSSILDVRVTNNGVDLSPGAVQLLVYATPQLLGIEPATGPRTGGTPVNLTVEGWGLPTTGISFGVRCQWGEETSTAGEITPVADDTAIEWRVHVSCTSPPETMVVSAGSQEWGTSDTDAVQVTLQIDGKGVDAPVNGTTATGPSFTYYEVPVVLDASPSAGSTLGGTDVVIKGSGFAFGTPGQPGSGQTVCLFGQDEIVFAAVVSDSELRCRAPPFTGGRLTETTGVPVDVKVSMNGGVDYYWTPSVFFQYLPTTSTTGEQRNTRLQGVLNIEQGRGIYRRQNIFEAIGVFAV